MKVSVVWLVFTVFFMEAYSFVVSGKDTVLANFVETENLDNITYEPSLNGSDVIRKPNLCIDKHGRQINGIIGYKMDCRKFVQCGDGTEHIADCQPELLFNEATKSCDWPHLANCVEFRAKDETKLVIPTDDITW